MLEGLRVRLGSLSIVVAFALYGSTIQHIKNIFQTKTSHGAPVLYLALSQSWGSIIIEGTLNSKT